MQTEPQAPYIFQPDPPFGSLPSHQQRIFAIAGPGSEKFRGKRFTRAEAEQALDTLVLDGVGMLDSFLSPGGRRCEQCGGQMAHYRLHGYRCLGGCR